MAAVLDANNGYQSSQRTDSWLTQAAGTGALSCQTNMTLKLCRRILYPVDVIDGNLTNNDALCSLLRVVL